MTIGGFGGSLFTYVVLHLYYICIIYRIMLYLKLLTILYICFPFCLTVCYLFLHIVNKLVTLPSVSHVMLNHHVISTSNRQPVCWKDKTEPLILCLNVSELIMSKSLIYFSFPLVFCILSKFSLYVITWLISVFNKLIGGN